MSTRPNGTQRPDGDATNRQLQSSETDRPPLVPRALGEGEGARRSLVRIAHRTSRRASLRPAACTLKVRPDVHAADLESPVRRGLAHREPDAPRVVHWPSVVRQNPAPPPTPLDVMPTVRPPDAQPPPPSPIRPPVQAPGASRARPPPAGQNAPCRSAGSAPSAPARSPAESCSSHDRGGALGASRAGMSARQHPGHSASRAITRAHRTTGSRRHPCGPSPLGEAAGGARRNTGCRGRAPPGAGRCDTRRSAPAR